MLQAPISALFRSGDRWAAFRVEDGRSVLAPVEVGRRNARAAEGLGGLAEGDMVDAAIGP